MKLEGYKGMLFSILSDSIGTLEGYSVPYDATFYQGEKKLEANIFLPQDTWWGQVIEDLGGELLVNNSISGSMVCKCKSCIVPTYGCCEERTSGLDKNGIFPNVIMIYMGTNDWGNGTKVSPFNDKESKDISIFSVAYEQMIEGLQKSYKDAQIWCITLPVSDFGMREGKDFPYWYRGRHLNEYNEAIRKIAKNKGCVLIDLYENIPKFTTIDGFHPDFRGMNTISQGILSMLKEKV